MVHMELIEIHILSLSFLILKLLVAAIYGDNAI